MRKLLLALLLCPALAQAANETFYVDKLGSNANSCATAQTAESTRANAKLTINAGLACMSVNSTQTLIIGVGTYVEEISPGVPSTIPTGTSFTNAGTIKARTGESVIIDPSSTVWAPLYLSGKAFVKWQDLIINGDSQASGEGHVFAGFNVDSNRFTNVTFRNSPSGSGVFVDVNSSSNEFINCTFDNNGNNFQDHGIYISGSSNLVEGSTSKNNSGYGVHVYRSSGTTTSNNIIRNNFIFNNGEDTAASSLSFGIILASGSGNMAYNNVVRENGVGSGRAGGIQIGSGGAAACTNCRVYNNTIVDNNDTYAIACPSGQCVTAFIRNNVICNTTQITNPLPAGTNASNNFAGTVAECTSQGIFTSISTDDYTVAAGSSLIDSGATGSAGTEVAAVLTTDILGITRANGTTTGLAYDRGAYEFQSPPDTITLLTPNGGESWEIGTTQTVTWGFAGSFSTVDINEDRDGNGSYETAIANDTSNDGTHDITVGGSAGASRKMQVCDSDGSPCDVSDAVYAATSSTPQTITMTFPTSGLHFFPGQTMALGYTTTGLSGNLNFYISYNNGTFYQPTPIVADFPLANPDASWVVTGPSGTQVKFKACSVSAPAVCDETDAVKIAGTVLSIQ